MIERQQTRSPEKVLDIINSAQTQDEIMGAAFATMELATVAQITLSSWAKIYEICCQIDYAHNDKQKKELYYELHKTCRAICQDVIDHDEKRK